MSAFGQSGHLMLTVSFSEFDPTRSAPGKLAKDRRCKSFTG
jgi:hypothetical protein